MRTALALIALCIALAALLMWGMGWASDQAARAALADGQARALVIEARADYQERVIQANNQARMNAATANALMLTAAAPWGVLGLLGCFGLGVVVLGFALIARRPSPPQIIQREIIYLPPPGQSRRETWQALSAGDYIEIPRRLEGGNR